MSTDSKVRVVVVGMGCCFGASAILWLLASPEYDVGFYTIGAGVFFFLAMAPILVLAIIGLTSKTDVATIRARIEAGRAEERKKRLNWPRGRATVLRLTDLGGRENDSIQARCELEIRSEDFRSSPYRTSLELFVPPLGVPRVVPGSTVPIAIDPADKNAIVILWEEP